MAMLTIYRSSAGSGKTHTLVSAYLQLALANPTRFQEILAVTFTNQATREMKQRILTYLHSLSQGLDSPIANELLQVHGWTKPALQTQAQALLTNILHHYDQFTVSTIDSFLQTIIRGFAKELGIHPPLNIEMQQAAVLEELINELVDHASHDQALEQWLVRFADHKLMQGQSWNFKQQLKQLGYELFTEAFSTQATGLVPAIRHKTHLNNFLAKIQQTIVDFEAKLQELGKASMQAIQDADLAIPDFAYGQRGVAGYLAGLQQKKSFTPTQRALDAQHHIATWHTKNAPKKQAIMEAVEHQLQAILKQAISFYQTHHQNYYTAVAVQQSVYSFGVIAHLLEKLQDYRAKNKVMLVSDATHLLRQVIAENDTPFIYEKIGTYYKHFLIDEFQDISGSQWQNIKPLISNSLAEGHQSLLVGDVKQSIYRWRGGNWRLLLTQLAQEMSDTATTFLKHNWRSKQHIIDFNNTFFTEASLWLVKHLQSELQDLANPSLQQALITQIQELGTAYQDVYQQKPKSCLQEDQGYVQFSLLAEKQTANEQPISWQAQVKVRLPLLLEELQAAGYALQDIALLVRNNAEARELFQTLLTYQHTGQAKQGYRYDALSAESLYLGHNPWINIIINALKCLAAEKNDLAQAELTYLYQYYVCQADPGAVYADWSSTAKQKVTQAFNPLLPERFTTERASLQNLPLYERIAALVAIFQLQGPEKVPFIQALQDAVLQYIQKEPAASHHFLAWWEATGSKLSLPRMQGQDAISIMTIHQAKGLQFKVVILPFCDWAFDHSAQKPPMMWCHADIPPFSDFPVLPLHYSKKLKDTLYIRAYYEEQMQAYLDNLNLLYVAFTRPQDRLYAFAQHASKQTVKTTSDLLLHIFAQEKHQQASKQDDKKAYLAWKQHWEDHTQTLTIGTPKPVTNRTSQAAEKYTAPFLLNDWWKQLNVTPTPRLLNQEAELTNILTKKYEWVSLILKQLPKATQLQDHLAGLQVKQGLSQAAIKEIKNYILALWHHQVIKAWYQGTWVMQQHASLIAPTGKIYQPSRIMTQGNIALAVSFITNPMDYDQAHEQIQGVALLLKDMGYHPINAYLLDIPKQTLHIV